MEFDDDVCVHYLNIDFTNDFLGEDVRLYGELPYPIHRPFKNSQTDIIEKYCEDLEAYNSQLFAISKEFPLVKNEVMNQTFADSHVRIPSGLLQFCNTEKWEVPYPCDYNPYFATGVLEHFQLDNKQYLIRPDCKNRLRMTDLSKPWKSPNLQLDFQLTSVFGLSASSNIEAIYLLVRQRNEINLLRVKDVSECASLQWTKKCKRSILDTKFHEAKVGRITSDLKFRLYDVETDKKLDIREEVNGAIRLDFVDNHSIMLLGRKNLKIVDTRSGGGNVLEPDLDDCNGLCAVKKDENILYLSTRHHLIRTDIRLPKEIESCTHLMKYSPCYLDLLDDVLCLSSQKVKDKALFGGKPVSSLPSRLPSVCDSVNQCRLTKDILLKDGLIERTSRAVAGIKLVSHDGDHFLYTVNSLGDVFRQKISSKVEEESDAVVHFHYWVSKLPGGPKTLHLTNLVNMSDARFALNKRIKKEYLAKYKRPNKKAAFFLNHFNNIYNKNNLGELAANFVSIWEVEEEEEEEERARAETELAPAVQPLEKVTSWIESSYFFE